MDFGTNDAAVTVFGIMSSFLKIVALFRVLECQLGRMHAAQFGFKQNLIVIFWR